MKIFKCPKCHVIEDGFIIHDCEEEKNKVEFNYDKKVKEFEEIIKNHNDNLKDEYYEEENTVYILGIFLPRVKKTKHLKLKNVWRLYTTSSELLEGRTGIFTGISDAQKFEIYLGTHYPVNKEYQIVKYDKYSYIECSICKFKQYV